MSWIGWLIGAAVVFNVLRSAIKSTSRSTSTDANPSRIAPPLPPPVPVRAAAPRQRRVQTEPDPPPPLPELLSIGTRPAGALHGFFQDGKSLRRAIIASEIFGPPVALKENSHWQM